MKRRQLIAGVAAVVTAPAVLTTALGQQLRGGRPLRIAIPFDIINFDPMHFSGTNFPIIKNLYDSLIEYTPEGQPVPSLASAWQIASDSKSVTLTLRQGVKFHSGNAFDAQAVAATLTKAAHPLHGRNLYPTMSIVQDWAVVDAQTIRLNFKAPAPERQITDLLQFLSIIDPAGIETIDQRPAGTGAYTLAERLVGQRIRMTANPNYWRPGEPVCSECVLTIFSDDAATAAALESGAVDIIYAGTSRSAVRLRNAGYQLVQGPGMLVQVLRLNSTRGPFRNAKFRQAFNFLMDRAAMLRVGYAGLGQATALPWVPASPAWDPAYNERYAFNLDRARELLRESGLSAAEQNNWRLTVNGGDESTVLISQIVQSTVARAGMNIQLDLKVGAEMQEAVSTGRFDATFWAAGNVQKFPSRLSTNSIYRTQNNPVLGEPHPHPEYVAAIERVNATLGSGADVRAAYDNLNRALIESAFAIATNTYDFAPIVAARNVGGITREIDNMLVARTLGFAS